MARRNSRFVNQKIVIGNKSIQEGDLTDSARDALGADSDFVKDVIFKLDSDFVNLGFGIDGSSIRDSSITQDKLDGGVLAEILSGVSGLDSTQTVGLIYPGGAIYKVTEYTPNNGTNAYSVSAATNGAFVFMSGASGGGGGSSRASDGGMINGGGGGGSGGGLVKLSRSDLEAANIIQIGNGGAGGAAGNNTPGSASAFSGSAGAVTKISTANASIVQANGGSGGNKPGSNNNGNGGAGGTFNFDTANVVGLYTYTGNSGNSGINRGVGGNGGTVGRNPPLQVGDIGTGLALFKITSDSDEIAREIIDTPNSINSGTGGRGGYNSFVNYSKDGVSGNAGQIIIYEFK